MDDEKDKAAEHKQILSRRSSQKLVEDIDNVISGYEIEELDEPDAFCSGTISWYNVRLRKFTNVVVFFVVLCVFFHSYILIFNWGRSFSGIDDLADILYIILVFLRSRTGHLIDGVEERNLLKVRERYQTSIAFFIDLITMIPWSLLRNIIPGDAALYRIIDRQKTYLRLHYVIYYIGLREEEPGSSTIKFRTILYLTLSSMVIHFSACGWYGLACSNQGYNEFTIGLCTENSWILHSLIAKIYETTTVQNLTLVGTYAEQVTLLPGPYVASLYWAAASSFSTGFGDIHAYTISEKIFSVFAMLIGMAFLYGMTVSGITSMLINNDARRADFTHYWNAFKDELENMHVRQHIKDLCLGYCDYIWHRWKGDSIYELGTLSILPDTLQITFAEYAYKTLFARADILRNAEYALCRNLARVSHHCVYLEGQYVQRSGEIDGAMCYVHRGVIEVLDPDEKVVLAEIVEGNGFGQAHLVFDLPRLNSLRCKTDCEIFILDKHEFSIVLLEYPEASDQLKEGIRKKCEEYHWPLEVPSISDYETLNKQRSCRKQSITTGVDKEKEKLDSRRKSYNFDSLAVHDLSESTRLTTVATTQYDGIGLVRAAAKVESEKQADVAEAKTWFQRLEKATEINPEGRFYTYWEFYIFYLSIFTFFFSSTLTCCKTTMGKEVTYYGDDILSLPLLDIAIDTEHRTAVLEKLYKCDASADTFATIDCIEDAGGSFANMINGNSSSGYSVMVPATWDISQSALNLETTDGIVSVLISYLLIDVSMYINILVNLRTGVKTTTGMLKSFKDIKKHYFIYSLFGFDLLIVAPLEILAPVLTKVCWKHRVGKYVWWAVLRNNRILGVFRFVPALFQKLQYSLDVNIVRLKLTEVVLYILFFTHTISALNYGYSCAYPNKIVNDWSEDGLYPFVCFYGSRGWEYGFGHEQGLFRDYMLCFYYTTSITTSTGYGEFPCTTKTKMYYAMIIMALGTVMFGWLVAVISSIVSSDASAVSSFTNAIKATKDYLIVHSVPLSLVDRVLDCRYIQWVRFGGDILPGVDTIDRKLPQNFHEMLMFESMGSFLSTVPLFHDLHPGVISMLCKNVEAHHYSEGDIVIYEGEMCMGLYIIKQGHCLVVTENLEESYDDLHPGDYFGEVEVLVGRGSSRTVVTDTACEILLLKRDDICEVIAAYPPVNAEIAKIAEDTSYHEDMLRNIDLLKNKPRTNMEKRFNIHQIAGNVQYYGANILDEPSVHRITSADSPKGTKMWEEMNPLLRFICTCFLMPITFDPRSKPYILYETYRVIMTIATLIVVPLQIAFIPLNRDLMILQYVLDASCLIDQYIKLHTMYYNDRKILVHHPIYTARNYLRTSFFVDFLSWFPFEVFALAAIPGTWDQHQWRFFAFLRILRALQIYKMLDFFQYWRSDVRYKRRYVKQFCNFLYSVILHHWVACTMFTSACQPDPIARNYNDTSAWVTLDGVSGTFYTDPESWIGRVVSGNVFAALSIGLSTTHQYLISLYWATATLVCVGYGDVYAVTSLDRIVSSFTMILGVVYYSMILGDIAANLQMDDINRAKFKKRVSDIHRFFKLHDVSTETRKQVENYYAYLWERTRGVTPSELLAGLPPSIKTSVCQSMYDDMLRESFVCANETSTGIGERDINRFFRLLSTLIQPRIYYKNSVIFGRGDIGHDMYFVQSGNVAIMEEDDVTIAKVLGPGQYFGEVALFSSMPRTRKAVVLTNCDLSVLTKQDLDYILERFPQFKQIMNAIAEDRKVSGTASKSYVRPKSKADVTQNIVYDEDGNRNDGQDKFFYSKILDHESTFANIWDHITIILAFFSSCLVIYQAAFLTHNATIDTLGFLMDVWFVMDMMICFHTSYLDQFGNTVDTKNKIHTYYGKDWTKFAFDCVTNFPFEIFAHAAVGSGTLSEVYATKLALLSFLRLNRVLRMKKLYCKLMAWEKDLQKDTLFVRMYTFVLFLCFIINFFGSFFYFVACPGGTCGEKAWTTVSNTNYKAKGIRGDHILPWVDGCYWVVTTMTSTGYGDIKPETAEEILFSCVVMVVGKLVIGYVLSMMAATLANDDERKVNYEKEVDAVEHYMVDLKFDAAIRVHIEQYYDYMWMKKQGVQYAELFNDLCFSLRADIYSQLCGDDLKKNELFVGCSENFMRQLCSSMRIVSYMPSDYICVQDDVRDEMFIINRGVAEVFECAPDGKNIPIRLILEGESLLCESVLKKTRLSYSVRARSYVDTFFLGMNELQTAVGYYPDDGRILLENAARLYPMLNL